jgi:hypothetical protein
MKKTPSHKSGKDTVHKHDHSAAGSHSHVQTDQSKSSHPFAAFFGCCLGAEPAPVSPKIQQLREQLPELATEELVITPGQPITITKDMIIGDVLANFPLARSIFEEIHPLGLLSPRLDQISIEMFLSDLNTDADQICASLTSLINA